MDYFIDDNTQQLEDEINRIASAGITLGCDKARRLYCPDKPVTRAQMAAFLTRALKLPTPTNAKAFADIPTDHTFRNAIAAIASAGITLGCDKARRLYCPDKPVTRAQMAAFLTRALKLPTPTNAKAFADIPTDHTFRNAIAAIASAGITLGCDKARRLYCPDKPVTRAQMAAFLTRALEI